MQHHCGAASFFLVRYPENWLTTILKATSSILAKLRILYIFIHFCATFLPFYEPAER